MTQTLLTKLLQPLRDIIAPQAETINQQYPSEKLFYADFVAKLLFGYLYQVPSLRMLALELKSNDVCPELGLSYTPFSTLKDGFARFPSYLCRQLFETVVVQSKLAQVGPLAEMGVFRVVDGSFFPTLLTMGWTAYRKTKNACKLHLSFDLNQMIPAEFWVSSGKASERKFLLGILETGLTYIADRGYFGFDVMAKIMQAKAFFVLRGKEKVLYRIVEKLPVVANLPSCFRALTDELVLFSNDPQQNQVRLITFQVYGSLFRLVTNRFDLTTQQVIILYAYRWQVELFFKFIKRTLNGLHLLNQSQNGVEIQFYLLLTLSVLLLEMKQTSQAACDVAEEKAAGKKKSGEKSNPLWVNAGEWVKNIAQIFYEKWKISRGWLLVVKNSLAKVVDVELLRLLNSC